MKIIERMFLSAFRLPGGGKSQFRSIASAKKVCRNAFISPALWSLLLLVPSSVALYHWSNEYDVSFVQIFAGYFVVFGASYSLFCGLYSNKFSAPRLRENEEPSQKYKAAHSRYDAYHLLMSWSDVLRHLRVLKIPIDVLARCGDNHDVSNLLERMQCPAKGNSERFYNARRGLKELLTHNSQR